MGKYSDYTLTAIFAEAENGIVNGRVWPVTIGREYKTVEEAHTTLKRLEAKYSGTQSEIIDYTITRSELT